MYADELEDSSRPLPFTKQTGSQKRIPNMEITALHVPNRLEE